eukprot:m.115992 g.115992  ORF g.115992 m.115992 type:complete len:689 (-) comp15384_c0_seq1:147-2213(-)
MSGSAADVLARRLRGRLPNRSFQPVDYNAVRSLIKDNRRAGVETSARIKALTSQKAEEEAKQKAALHQQMWSAELARLNGLSTRAEQELQDFLDKLAEESRNEQLLELLIDHNAASQASERDKAAIQLKVSDARSAARRAYRRYGPSARSAIQRRQHQANSSIFASSASVNSDPKALKRSQSVSVHSSQNHKDEDIQFVLQTKLEMEEDLDVLKSQEQSLFDHLVSRGCVEACVLTVPAALQLDLLLSSGSVDDTDVDAGEDDADLFAAASSSMAGDWQDFVSSWRADFDAIIAACTLPGLASQLRRTFQESMRHCRERLIDLHDAYLDVISTPYGNWAPDEHYLFDVALSSYTSAKTLGQLQFQGLSARQLAFDYLRKALPHQNRKALADHDEWLSACRFYTTMRKQVTLANQREMTACLDDIRGILAEEMHLAEQRRQQLEEQTRTQEHQLQLMQRLLELRRQRMERMQEEAKQQHALEAQARAIQIKEEQREHRHRERVAKALANYHAEQQAMKEYTEAQQAEQLQQLLEHQRQQARVNAGRVTYRQEQHEQKLVELEAQRLAKEQEETEREARLEALRQQVRPTEIPDDPGRILRPTKAMEASMMEAKRERELKALLPTMGVLGYDDKSITSDPRFKLAAALRKAGLQTSDYARQAMMRMQGAAPSRRDAESTLYRPDGGFKPA